jgi:hypothetical protein
MKIISIGDVHGTSHWKKILFGGDLQFENFFKEYEENPTSQTLDKYPIGNCDRVVFVGDYFDSFVVGNAEMKSVFLDLIKLKRTFMEKVILLIGNHDIHYIDSHHRCSGFRAEMYHDFNQMMRENRELFQMAYQNGNYLWTHAGLTDSMWNLHCIARLNQAHRDGIFDLTTFKYDEALNFLYEVGFMPILWAGRGRGGYSSVPGVIWADKRELINDPLKGISQIVGHTPVHSIETYTTEDSNVLHFIDCQERGTMEPLVVESTGKHTEATFKNLKKLKY